MRVTVRLRLTLLYGVLFLLSGAALLAVTFVLVDRADQGLYVYDGGAGTTTVRQVKDPPATPEPPRLTANGGDGLSPPAAGQDDALADLARRQRAEQRRTLLVQGGIALAIMAVASVGLGWTVAGRVLRRIRTVTSTARRISATNLDERLALPGPADELKDLGDTFDALLARLEGAFEAQRGFVANASHELRTPMARQRALAQVALADPDASAATLREAHLRVIEAGREQERMVSALLTLARGQAGIDRAVPVDLRALAGDVLASRRDRADGLTVRASLEAATASGDPALAERLVDNLVDNALRHNVAGGRVEVSTGTEGGRAVLTVANTGPAVAAGDVERLLRPFQRAGTDRTRDGGGLGLGLSIVDAIATAHGAELRAVPGPDGGLSVTVRFRSA